MQQTPRAEAALGVVLCAIGRSRLVFRWAARPVKFGIAMEIDGDAMRNADAVQRFADHLGRALDQDYGVDLYFTIGVICIRNRPGFAEWHRPRPPRFRARAVVRLLDGTSKELANVFGYDLRLSDAEYDRFVSAEPRDAAALVSAKLSESLGNLASLPSRVSAAFDRGRFERDFERYSQVSLDELDPTTA